MCFNLCSDDNEGQNQPGPQPYQQQPYQQQQGYAQNQQPMMMQPPANANNQPQADPETYQITQGAIETWLASKKDDGEVEGIGWWQVANGYTAISLHDSYVHSARNAVAVRTQLDRCSHKTHDLINEFNDDTLWFAHALLDLSLSVHGQDRWLVDAAHKIYAHVSRYQLPHGKFFIEDGRADMGGAMLWTSKPDEDGANTITTALFAEFASRLALETPATPQDPERRAAWGYLEAAERAIGWILKEVYRREDHVILDGISMNKSDRCGWTFTYTTGQTIAALVAFSRALRSVQGYGKAGQAGEYMETACTLAHASVSRGIWVNEEGILIEHKKEEWKAEEGGDGWVFQSVLVRAMAKLHVALRQEGWARQGGPFAEAEGDVRKFIETQYKALVTRNCRREHGKVEFGPWWQGDFEHPTTHSQLSVLDVMAAIHAVRD